MRPTPAASLVSSEENCKSMYPSLRARIFALLISHTLVCVLPLSAQDAPQKTRPRRVSTPAPTAATPDNSADVETNDAAPRVTAEPFIRIGLATDARSVTISTTGRLLNTSDTTAAPAPLEVARVRVEPRHLPPATDGVEGSTTVDESAAPSASEASAQAAPQRAGSNRRNSGAGVKLSSRTVAPVRGAVVYATGTTPLFDSRAPLVFASVDEALHPLKYNEKAYRGRLEVFPNARGTLTVVNVVGLEDYLRGVVPNELSPGGFPALEALKAQAVAARTYAVSNRGQFARDGFDLLPTTRSQVYGGLSTEHPLTDRAVAETRGRVATYKGRPINALYTSTCGGRTEHGEHIFGGDAEQVSYLRARECAVEGQQREALAPRVSLRTSREPAALREAEHATSARDAALLSAHNFQMPARLSDEWLAAPVSLEEVRALVAGVAALARQSAPVVTSDAVRPPAFASALAHALDGESRGDVLLARADVEYLLAFRDAAEIPAHNRADVAQLLREGHLSLHTDATLRPRQALSRARVLRAVARAVEARGLLRLQKATARLAADGTLLLRPTGKGADRPFNGSREAYLFRAFGDALYQVRELTLVGGEAVLFHTDARGEVDYMEVRPAQNGAASDRFSTYANWTVELTPAEVASRLSRTTARTGTVVDLRVRSRGASRRALDLEVVGTQGVAHVMGGRIRTALGLREQLFVIERRYDEAGRVVTFVFQGRGWGHGVGMCQVGAYGLARAGLSYDKILKSYYTGISLTQLY